MGDTAFRDIVSRMLGATEPIQVILAPNTSRIARLPLAVECTLMTVCTQQLITTPCLLGMPRQDHTS